MAARFATATTAIATATAEPTGSVGGDDTPRLSAIARHATRPATMPSGTPMRSDAAAMSDACHAIARGHLAAGEAERLEDADLAPAAANRHDQCVDERRAGEHADRECDDRRLARDQPEVRHLACWVRGDERGREASASACAVQRYRRRPRRARRHSSAPAPPTASSLNADSVMSAPTPGRADNPSFSTTSPTTSNGGVASPSARGIDTTSPTPTPKRGQRLSSESDLVVSNRRRPSTITAGCTVPRNGSKLRKMNSGSAVRVLSLMIPTAR